MPEQWEVVGKAKIRDVKVSKKSLAKQQVVETAQKIITQQNEVIESDFAESTTFTAFMPKDEKKAKKSPKQKRVKVEVKEVVKPKTLEQIAAEISRDELQSVFTQAHDAFPGNADIWLKDLASFLNIKFEKIHEVEPVCKGKPADYPLRILSKRCRDVLANSLKQCEGETLEHLYYHCIQSMLTDSQKGLSTFGYRIFIQALASFKPDIPLAKFPQYLELLKTHHNRPVRCLSILWALGQGGAKDFNYGLRVWLDLMMPALGFRSIAPYCVEYIEQLFIQHKDLKKAYGSLSMRDYFQVLDILFSSAATIPSDLKSRLLVQYPKFKEISLDAKPAKTLREFFPSLLARASPSSSQQLKKEILPTLVTCLLSDKQTFTTWSQMYAKHLPQSGCLLGHIKDKWTTLSRKFDRKSLVQTLKSFSITNEEIAAQKHVPDGLSRCKTICKELLAQLGPRPFPWGYVVFPVLMLLVGIVAFDIYNSHGWQKSRTVKFLNEYGILPVLCQAWTKTQAACTKAIGWSRENVPIMYAAAENTIGPALCTAWKTTTEFVTWSIEASQPHREYAMLKIMQGINWVYELNPQLWPQICSYFWMSCAIIAEHAVCLWHCTLNFFANAYTWLLKYVLVDQFSPDNLYKTAAISVSALQEYTQYILGWCRQTIANVSS